VNRSGLFSINGRSKNLVFFEVIGFFDSVVLVTMISAPIFGGFPTLTEFDSLVIEIDQNAADVAKDLACMQTD